MRSTGSGPMGALLMLAPLVAVPILAVVGIPQFAPGNLIDINGSKPAASSRESRAYDEPRYGDAARHDADDLFAPLDESDSGIEGFDDPLAGRKSRSGGRNGRRDVDDEFAEEPVRSRGKRASSFDENQDEFENNSADEPNSDEMEEAAPRGRSRQRLRSKSTSDEFAANNDAEPFNEFADTPSSKTKPRGERFADISSNSSFGGKLNARTSSDRRQQFEQQEPEENAPAGADEANPFEAPPLEEVTRPAFKKKPQQSTRPRDRHDAPIFEPQESAPAESAAAEDAASFAPPPAARSSNTGRRSPQAVVPPSPPETLAEQEEAPAAEENTGEEQVPGVEELTWKDATKRLRALGVGKSKQYFTYLEDSNSFLFSCTATHAKNAKKVQRFEAEAELPLLAVSQVLQQLEDWQSTTPSRTVARGPE